MTQAQEPPNVGIFGINNEGIRQQCRLLGTPVPNTQNSLNNYLLEKDRCRQVILLKCLCAYKKILRMGRAWTCTVKAESERDSGRMFMLQLKEKMPKNRVKSSIVLSAAVLLAFASPVSAQPKVQSVNSAKSESLVVSASEQEDVQLTEKESKFRPTVDSVEEGVSVLTISNAHFESVDGDIVAFDEAGEEIENLSSTIDSTPGASIEILNENQVRTTIDRTQYPELQLECGLSALAGGTGGMVATGLGLAAAGAVSGGAAFAILALGSAAGYVGGAAQGDCFN
ncbi:MULTISPECIES: hypothetical protein [Corynebacterium]|uniref:hypothetical protein n=1 Tax=Corynebacterium TaxID=1716 RepID=UPI001054513B|nr:hypothetical protein [Corynebacterium hadale]